MNETVSECSMQVCDTHEHYGHDGTYVLYNIEYI